MIYQEGELKGRVLVRVDFNIPMSKDDESKIADDKDCGILPTIRKLFEDGGVFL
jgi:3-phosphoglycerate kinase